MSTTKASSFGSLAAPANWHEQDVSGHVAQFYADDDFLVDSVARFVGAALASDASAIVVATPTHRDGIRRRLAARGLESVIAKAGRRYVALDAAETLSSVSRDGWPDAAAFTHVVGDLIDEARAAAEGPQNRVVIFGEMVALLWSQGKSEAAIHLEQLWHDLGNTRVFSLRCAYPITDFYRSEHSDPFRKICELHSAVIPGESYSALNTEEERLRSITQLQQRAKALENEVLERKRAEAELKQTHDELEKRVNDRTLELAQKNLQIMRQSATLESANQGLRELSARLLRVQDEERRRIARDLHDSTGQTLALLSMNLGSLETEAAKINSTLAKEISTNVEIVRQVSSELRTLSYLLHPPLLDEMGLESAVRWFVEGFVQRSGIQIRLDLAGNFGRLSRHLETAIFRVIQECLTNIHRHSGSATGSIGLHQEAGRIALEIRDQGQGIAADKLEKISASGVSGLGFRGMRERTKDFGGELEIESNEKGTLVKVVIPVTASVMETAESGSAPL